MAGLQSNSPPRTVSGLRAPCDSLVAKIANWAGIAVQSEQNIGESAAIAVSASDLREIAGHHVGQSVQQTCGNFRNLFVYGVRPEHAEVLNFLCGPVLGRINDVNARDARLRVEQSSAAGALSGLEVDVRLEGECATFSEGPLHGMTPIMWLNGAIFFARLDCGSSTVYLSGAGLCDLDRTVAKGFSTLNFLPALAPAVIFFREVFGDYCWRNRRPMACFIIDDPLIRRKYGFLRFESLDACLAGKSAAASLAFIPWNSDRTDPKIARLFRRHPERLSISVHGCDHTRGEFGCDSERLLLQKSSEALARMRSHEDRFNVGFDRVMVFPQGIFASGAMRALKATGFVGAVNSTAFATDGAELPLRELLSAAVTTYDDFPLFLRRYPQNVAELAFDVFLGKPGLLVEHHSYFRYGYDALSIVLEFVNSLSGGIEWRNLDTICRQTTLCRRLADGNMEARFFGPNLLFGNTGPGRRVTFRKRERQHDSVRRVTVNGEPFAKNFEGDDLVLELEVDSSQAVEIALDYARSEFSPYRENRSSRLHIMARRYASEFRDNVISPLF
jgi:hypothetical protein